MRRRQNLRGRKRHVLTDTGGLLVAGIVHSAGVQDRDGAPDLLAGVRTAFPWLRHVFADAACGGTRLAGALDRLGRWTVEIVRRGDIAWLNRNRRLAKDFEIAIAET